MGYVCERHGWYVLGRWRAVARSGCGSGMRDHASPHDGRREQRGDGIVALLSHRAHGALEAAVERATDRVYRGRR